MSTRPAPRPRLRRLFAAYLNQDWRTLGATPEDVVRRFAAEVRPAEREAAAREAASLLARARSDAALDRALAAMRCGYDPAADGRTTREFLTALRDLLRGGASEG